MGGKEGVLEKQSIALSTLQPEGGLWVRCIPRSATRKDALPGMARAGSCGQLEALPEHPDESGAPSCILWSASLDDRNLLHTCWPDPSEVSCKP